VKNCSLGVKQQSLYHILVMSFLFQKWQNRDRTCTW